MYEELVKRLREAPSDWPDVDLHYEAADAIESLDDIAQTYAETVQELKMKSQWTPVTERLPEICERDVNGNITFSGRVWSCTDYGNGFYWQQTDQYTTNCGGKWMSEVPEDDDFTPKVVAWMPLPEPPKEGT